MSSRAPRVQMARRLHEPRRPIWATAAALLGIAVLVLGGLAIVLTGERQPNQAGKPSASARPAVAGAPSPSGPSGTATPAAGPSARPSERSSPRASATPAATPRPSPAASTVGVRRSPAPRSAAQFDLVGQVIDIGFPLRPETAYRYRDNWLDRRAGLADPYNHARVAEDGRLLRLHDGIDIYGPEGAPVVAPFTGRVIDPSRRWTPWETDRYGLTVVIESSEPQTAGYAAVLVHLEHVWVETGQRVSRGQVIGVLGRTGNAEGEGIRAHLHFELRAPFEIDWSPMGENRRVDAFNPYPSLVRADPKL